MNVQKFLVGSLDPLLSTSKKIHLNYLDFCQLFMKKLDFFKKLHFLDFLFSNYLVVYTATRVKQQPFHHPYHSDKGHGKKCHVLKVTGQIAKFEIL